MKRKQSHILTAVLVDYDNIYLALRRKSEEAAKRFAKDAGAWLKEIENGGLITPTNSIFSNTPRRIVLNRCYGNPVPRRNTHDNSTDMSSFPFVRHHFLRSGFEVVDCPPLTAQLKNSSDIRMVMDVRDFLMHDTYFDEFVILSGDADFTPVLHRLRAHARRTVIFANDHTAVPYKAISDGEIRESDLIAALLGTTRTREIVSDTTTATPLIDVEAQRAAIVAEALAAVSASRHPIPVDLLAERVVRALGHDVTIASAWTGLGSFREVLTRGLPEGVRISEQPPYLVRDARRQIAAQPAARFELKAEPIEPQLPPLTAPAAPRTEAPAAAFAPTLGAMAVAGGPFPAQPPPSFEAPALPSIAENFASHFRSPLPAMPPASPAQPALRAPIEPQLPPLSQPEPAPVQSVQPQPLPPSLARMMQDGRQLAPQPYQQQPLQQPQQNYQPQPQPQPAQSRQTAPPSIPSSPAPDVGTASSLQQSIARIHDACQAPPLSPPEYRILFDVMAREISERGLAGSQTLTSIAQRAAEQGIDVRRDDVRFVLEVVSETDPWFEQGASASLFAGRFRNFVVARCRSQGLNLSADELDLIEAWFVAGAAAAAPPARQVQAQPQYQQQYQPQPIQQQQPAQQQRSATGTQADWRMQELPGRPAPEYNAPPVAPTGHVDEEFPRIVRTRLRG